MPKRAGVALVAAAAHPRGLGSVPAPVPLVVFAQVVAAHLSADRTPLLAVRVAELLSRARLSVDAPVVVRLSAAVAVVAPVAVELARHRRGGHVEFSSRLASRSSFHNRVLDGGPVA